MYSSAVDRSATTRWRVPLTVSSNSLLAGGVMSLSARFDLQQARGIAANDRVLFGRAQSGDTLDQLDRIVIAHVIRVVGAEQHVVRAVAGNHAVEQGGVEGQRIEVEL